MSEDGFLRDFEMAQKQAKMIANDLKMREDKIRQGLSVVRDNQSIQQQLNKLNGQIDSLNKIVVGYQDGETNIPPGEVDRRRKKLNELRNTYFDYNEKFKAAMGVLPANHTFKPSNPSTYAANVNKDTVTVTQLQADKNDLENRFSQKVEELSDATKVLKNDQVQMADELAYQNDVLLPQIERDVDDNTLKFIKNNKKLVKILKKGSDWCLWIVIVLELALLIYLVVS